MSASDQAELAILELASDNGKFAVPIGMPLTAEQNTAFEAGLMQDWYRLLDVAMIAAFPGVSRVFLLTDKGWHRRAVLRKERPN